MGEHPHASSNAAPGWRWGRLLRPHLRRHRQQFLQGLQRYRAAGKITARGVRLAELTTALSSFIPP